MKLCAKGLSLLLLICITSTINAAPFSFQFSETVMDSSLLGVSSGDNFVITVTVDNGGISNQNQEWTSADLVSVAFDINDGFILTSFNSPFDAGLIMDTGSITTDISGNLLTVMSNWFDLDVFTDFTTNTSDTEFAWFINGNNGVYVQGDGFVLPGTVDINNVERNIDPAYWSEVAPIPVPAALWLFGSALLGLIGLRKKQMS